MRSAATRQPLPRHVPFAKISSVALWLRFSGAGLLGLGHDKRLRERPSDRFCIIGIDQQGAAEIDRGAGEARQDEDVFLPKIISGRSGDAGLKGLVRRTRPVDVQHCRLSEFSAAYTIDTLGFRKRQHAATPNCASSPDIAGPADKSTGPVLVSVTKLDCNRPRPARAIKAPALMRTQQGHSDLCSDLFLSNLLISLVGAQGLEPWTR
jgi:hypothetical protein